MKIRIPLISLFLLSTSAHAAFDNQIITKDSTVSSILLAGKIGEAAMFSVQADDDDDLEIFATASSKIDTENDHWRLLDWDGANYQVIKTGKLQKADQEFLTGHQISYSEILLGHKNGLLSTVSFTDDPDEAQHSINETQSLLSEYEHTVIGNGNGDIDSDVKAIVSLTGTDQADYTVLCTEDYLHILDAAELKVTFDQGGYCQTGNLDYETIAPGIYDQELITASGIFLTFDGTQWIEKTNLNTDSFGDNFKVGNIDDDDADEILSQDNATQLQAFSPFGGSWVYISSIKNCLLYTSPSPRDS